MALQGKAMTGKWGLFSKEIGHDKLVKADKLCRPRRGRGRSESGRGARQAGDWMGSTVNRLQLFRRVVQDVYVMIIML